MQSERHRPVLLHEAVELLAIQKDDTVVDATLGGAGHALSLAQALGKEGTLIGFDLDPDAIDRAREALAAVHPRTFLVHGNFRNLVNEVSKLGIAQITKALFDLGWSSYQLDSGRGFSLKSDEPLLMTYSSSEGGSASRGKDPVALTAGKIVNEWAEESLADVIFGWGEERYSRRIAKAIVERRESTPFTTARDLAEVIYAAVPPRYRFGKIHPATRTFQALRIAVNDELGALSDGLAGAWGVLSKGGRIAVITFHSIEDRLVKQTFKQWEDEGGGKRITPKDSKLPTGQARKSFVVPSAKEVAENPRSRSAKLRVIEKF